MSQFFIDVGKIKLTWQGNWSNSTAYVVDDLVWFDDGSTVSTYICVADNTNQSPSATGTVNTTYWNLFAGGGLAGGLQPGGTGSNQIQIRSGLALGGEAAFTYDPATDVMSVPAIAVTGGAAGSPTRDVDITGSIRATEIYEGSNRLTYNIGGGQITSGTVNNDRLPASINVTDLSATTSLTIKTSGLKFDSSTDRVGIGTAVPGTRLDVRSVALATEDDVVARFRSDHTNNHATLIEVQPNTSQASKSGIVLHKNSTRVDGCRIINDNGTITIDNQDTAAPKFNVDLGGTNRLMLTGTQVIVNNPLVVNGCFDENYLTPNITSNTLTLDATQASVFGITLNQIVNTLNITLPANSRAVSVTMIITSNGSYSIAWPANTRWAGGNIPTLSQVAGRIDVITLTTTNQGATWLGFVGGTEFQ